MENDYIESDIQYTCSECSQCRYDNEEKCYFCRRSGTKIYDIFDSSACDDFEKDD